MAKLKLTALVFGFAVLAVTAGCSKPPEQTPEIRIQTPPVTQVPGPVGKPRPVPASCDPKAKTTVMYVTNHPINGESSYTPNNIKLITNDSNKMGLDQLASSILYGGKSGVLSNNVIFPTHPFIAKSKRDIFREIKDLSTMCNIAFLEWGTRYPYQSELMIRHPEFFLNNNRGQNFLNSDGVKLSYLNLLHPSVREGFMDYIRVLAANRNVDVIQLDDHLAIGLNFGYNPEFIAAFDSYLKENKISYRGNRKAPSPSEKHWVAFRTKVVADFFADIVATAKKANPNIQVTVVSGELDFMKANYLQDHTMLAKTAQSVGEQHYGHASNRDVSQKIAKLPKHLSVALLLGIGNESVSNQVLQKNVDAVRNAGHKQVLFFGHRECYGAGPKVQNCQNLLQRLVADFRGKPVVATKPTTTPTAKPQAKPVTTKAPTVQKPKS
jgi:Glycosyl hydrolase-like 10